MAGEKGCLARHVMQNNQRISRGNLRCAAIAVCLLIVSSGALSAGEAILKNGVHIKGKLVPIQALTLRLTRQKRGPNFGVAGD